MRKIIPITLCVIAYSCPVTQALAGDSSKAEYLRALKTIERFKPYERFSLPELSEHGYRAAEDTSQVSEGSTPKENRKRKWRIPSWYDLTAILPQSPERYRRRSINDGKNPFDGLSNDELGKVDFVNVIEIK